MADRNFQKKKRNTGNRKRKPVMLITAEGKNKTEQLYFTSFQSQYGKYSVKYVKTSKDTDPAGMYKSLDAYWKSNELSEKNGDKAYIVLDLDCNEQKAKLIGELSRKSKNIQFIVSNPCIEVWFMMHFTYSTHQFMDSKEPKRELRKYIAGYEENSDIGEILKPLLPMAMTNAERFRKHYEEIGSKWLSTECNPMTDVWEIISEMEVFKS
ncbi:MAG: RloB family protein [Lachnospiraceae bacterium]